jgi:hypothetical protein
VFSRGGLVRGTLPLAAAGCDGATAPDLMVALAWDGGANAHGVPGRTAGSGAIAVGAGDHGGISPFEMHNTLIATGPDFRVGVVSHVPCGIVDIAPTIAHCLGLEPPAAWDGRVLVEALRAPAPAPVADTGIVEVAFPGGRQVLTLSRVRDVAYVDEARIVRA